MTEWNPDDRSEQVRPITDPIITHALSVREPYAWLIAGGWKNVENRTFPYPSNRPLPAWVAIHASATRPTSDDDAENDELAEYHPDLNAACKSSYWRENPTHRVIGVSEIIGAMRVVQSINGKNYTPDEIADVQDAFSGRSDRCRHGHDPMDWLSDDCHNWIIDDVYRFKNPIVCKGFLNVWQMPIELAKTVNQQFRQAVKTGGLRFDQPYGPSLVHEMPKGVDKKIQNLYECGVA